MQSEGLRFEVLVNGVRRCMAGSVGPGSLAAEVIRWRSRSPDEPPESAHLIVQGSRTDNDLYIRWVAEDLNLGDEITIRVLGPGACDEPSHRAQRDA